MQATMYNLLPFVLLYLLSFFKPHRKLATLIVLKIGGRHERKGRQREKGWNII
jgi:hypothetical protein